jgi:hypothetical protein
LEVPELHHLSLFGQSFQVISFLLFPVNYYNLQQVKIFPNLRIMRKFFLGLAVLSITTLLVGCVPSEDATEEEVTEDAVVEEVVEPEATEEAEVTEEAEDAEAVEDAEHVE